MAVKETPKPSLLEALKLASQKDLDEINERITELRIELGGLELASKLIHCRLHGKPPRKQAGQGNGTPLVERLYELLSQRGKATPTQLANLLGATPQGVGRALKHERFTKLDSGEWTIAKTADRQVSR